MKIKVGIIFGGASVEHEISIISAMQAISNINKDKYDVVPIYIDKTKNWYTGEYLKNINNYRNIDGLIRKCKNVSLNKINNDFWLIDNNKKITKKVNKIDVAFPIVHGQNVEDGTLAGYLETIGIPYVGSNVLGASLGQDKIVLKQVLESNNIPIVPYTWFYDYEYLENKNIYLSKIKKIGYPVIVKPATLGSSIGINYVSDAKEIEDAIADAIAYDKKIIVEKAVENLIEVNCSVLGNYKEAKASVIEEVLSRNSILTYNDKYIEKSKFSKKKTATKGIENTDRIIPARIGEDLTKKIKKCSIDVFKILNLSGVCRIDYLINKKTNEFYINEPNTIPGSLSFYLWEASGKKYNELLDELIEIAIKNYNLSLNKINSFDTNILNDFSCKSVKFK